jgi:ribonuclease HII
VAAAVLVNQPFLEGRWAVTRSGRVNDSKQLTPAEREALWFEFETLEGQGEIHANYGSASVEEIETHNILGATKLAMRRALEGIYPPARSRGRRSRICSPAWRSARNSSRRSSCRILIDGLPLKHFPYPHTGIVRGDARSLCIAMASIIAKVTRDRLMNDLDRQFPGYGFAQHKGYGTEEHRDAVLRLGRCPQHREMFLRKLLAKRVDPAQMDFLTES